MDAAMDAAENAAVDAGASSTGSDLVFLERLWSPSRRIGVQGLGDGGDDDDNVADVEVFDFVQDRNALAKTVWPSALVLAQSIVPVARDLERDRGRKLRCLELGCGLGLVAKVLSALGHDVIATDKENGKVEAVRQGSVEVACFDWARIDQAPAEVQQGFDLIVGADLLYQKASHVPLAMALEYCISRSPRAKVVLAYQIRAPADEKVFVEKVCPSYGLEATPFPPPDPKPAPAVHRGVEFLSAQHLLYVRLLEVKRPLPTGKATNTARTTSANPSETPSTTKTTGLVL